jgi:DNA polymerase-3 subunit beta
VITVNRPELLRALKIATGVVGNGKTIPMLANVLLRSEGAGRLSISATDLRVSLSADLPCSFGDSFGAAFDARKIHELIANASADDISITIESNHWATIKSGKVTFKIAGLPDKHFPEIPDRRGHEFVTVENAMLREMIDRTAFAASDDESRPNLSGVHVSSDGSRITMTATDGYRVCRLSRSTSIPTVSAIVPCMDRVRSIISSAPTSRVALTKEHLFVVQDDTAIAIRLIEAVYPPMEPIYGMERKHLVTIGREAILIAMKRAGVMTTEQTGAKMALSRGMMRLSVVNPDLGEVHEDLDADYQGEPIAIGFNPDYVVEVLSAMSSDQIVIEIADPLNPALVRQVGNDDYAGIILPMRVL